LQANQFLIMTPMCFGILYVIFKEVLTSFVMILELISACVILMSYQQNSQEFTEDGV